MAVNGPLPKEQVKNVLMGCLYCGIQVACFGRCKSCGAPGQGKPTSPPPPLKLLDDDSDWEMR